MRPCLDLTTQSNYIVCLLKPSKDGVNGKVTDWLKSEMLCRQILLLGLHRSHAVVKYRASEVGFVRHATDQKILCLSFAEYSLSFSNLFSLHKIVAAIQLLDVLGRRWTSCVGLSYFALIYVFDWYISHRSTAIHPRDPVATCSRQDKGFFGLKRCSRRAGSRVEGLKHHPGVWKRWVGRFISKPDVDNATSNTGLSSPEESRRWIRRMRIESRCRRGSYLKESLAVASWAAVPS